MENDPSLVYVLKPLMTVIRAIPHIFTTVYTGLSKRFTVAGEVGKVTGEIF